LSPNAVDSQPDWRIFRGSFDAFGAWSLSATVPPGLTGHTATFRSYAIGFAGKAVDSSDVVVTFD